jgi:hypothetical protein
MFTFDPTVGTGTFLLIHPPLLSELTLRVADAAAERGEDNIADSFWQLGCLIAN